MTIEQAVDRQNTSQYDEGMHLGLVVTETNLSSTESHQCKIGKCFWSGVVRTVVKLKTQQNESRITLHYVQYSYSNVAGLSPLKQTFQFFSDIAVCLGYNKLPRTVTSIICYLRI